MSRRIRPTKSTQKIKEEQNTILLEDGEKNLEYKKANELKDKQSSDLKECCKALKKVTTVLQKKIKN